MCVIVIHPHVITVVDVLAKLWRPGTPQKELPVTVLKMPDNMSDMQAFISKYNAIREQLKALSVMDDLLSGIYIIQLIAIVVQA